MFAIAPIPKGLLIKKLGLEMLYLKEYFFSCLWGIKDE